MKKPKLINKIREYEYWPFWLLYLPVLPYWLYLAIRAKHPLYLTAANPGIEMGGFFGESKQGILDMVPNQYKPKTILVNPESNWTALFELAHMQFPLVAKPNIGERGDGVEKITSFLELQSFLANKKEEYLLQEYSNHPLEYGVLFYRLPGEKSGKVISLTGKKFMQVIGDGEKSIQELMLENPRFAKQVERLALTRDLNQIPEKNQSILLEPIGNHCRGTEFTNENHLINEKMNECFSTISRQMKGFYIGRFDLKAESVDSLYTGEGLHIMEVNGTTSEPGHIYDVDYSLIKAYRDIFSVMKKVYLVSVAVHKSEAQAYTKPSEFLSTLWQHFVVRKKPANKKGLIATA